MAEKGIMGRIFYVIYWHAIAINKYMKNYNKNGESSHLKYWNVNNLCRYATSQKFLERGFKWVKNRS